jgi:2-polyprenyl-3-methyl-5-hydroxy-6-metoxy-1,4-benzoquinol methylase
MEDSKKLWTEIDGAIDVKEIRLGRYTSDDYINDPKHLSFVTSRYKFAAKMLDSKEAVLEIGCGDGFGAPIVADAVGNLTCTDINEDMLERNSTRNPLPQNLTFKYADFRKDSYQPRANAIYLIDVIEHIYPGEESSFIGNVVDTLMDDGVLLLGTPNKTAEAYANEWSRKSHVNLKTHDSLRELGLKHFQNVFLFGMNDEVVHTGYAPMCHFLWALCVTPIR